MRTLPFCALLVFGVLATGLSACKRSADQPVPVIPPMESSVAFTDSIKVVQIYADNYPEVGAINGKTYQRATVNRSSVKFLEQNGDVLVTIKDTSLVGLNSWV